MSNKANEVWLESAYENFGEAIAQKNWEVAKSVVADTADKGFTSESVAMNKELREEMDKEPRAVHGYVLGFLKKKNEEYKAKGFVPTLDLLIEDLTN